MSRVGQCPSCRAVYELDEDAIGRVMDCRCGVALFVCDVAGFSEIPVHCTECEGEYVVDSDGAGEVVECDCGEHLTVPTVVLRQPVASPGAKPDALLAGLDTPTPDEALVACPQCGKQYAAVGDDVGDDAECGCGCVFVIQTRPDGTVFTQAKETATASEADESDDEKPQRRKKPLSLLPVLGVAAVGLLLLISIIMFVTRDQRKLASAKSKPPQRVTFKDTPRKDAATASPAYGSNSVRPPNMTPLVASPNQSINDSIRPIPAPGPATSNGGPKTGKRLSSLLAPPPDKPLPEPKGARKVIPIIAAAYRGLTFERAYAEAFAAYEETSRLKQAAEQSGDVAPYHRQLGETLGLLQQTLDLATRQSGNDKIDELRYLLTYLHFAAGRLAEASVLGEAVARWGDAEKQATREAAMIALAATQEANETGWGDASEVGELDQMASIAAIVAQRWPDNPQLDLIWMNLAQRYDAFGQSLRAAMAYARVPKSSPRYGAAQLAAGSALWAQYRRDANDGETSAQQKQLLQRAETLLSQGVESVAADLDKPTTSIMAAKLSLARIALVGGNLEKAESHLVEAPMAVVDSVVVAQGTETTVQVSEGFVRSVFETLFAIRTQRRDPAGAKEALELMASKVGGDSNFGKLFLGVATDYIDQLTSSPVVTREQFSTLSELIEPLKQHDSTLTVPNVLWLGESWSRLAERASSLQLATQCYSKAAAAYALAMNRSDFPASSQQSAAIRRAELLRRANQLTEVMPLLESILKQTPNAFGIQIEAAETLQQLAVDAGQPTQLVAAIGGPVDSNGKSTLSPIWGWSKLVTTLHSVGSSDDKQDPNRDRLLKCQYNLAKCQWLLGKATSDPAQREQLLSDCRRLLDRLVATTSPDREPWYSRLQELQSQANAAE